MSAQNLACFQGGGTVPSGLLHPPGKSSSTVMKNTPTKGQTTKTTNAVGPIGKWKTEHSAAVSIKLNARYGRDVGIAHTSFRITISAVTVTMLNIVLQNTAPVAYSVSALNSCAMSAVFTAVGNAVLRIIVFSSSP